MKKLLLAVFAFCFMPLVNADENICSPYKAGKFEPTELIIKEESFNYENALKALSVLGHVTEKPSKELKGSEQYISTANAEITLKGYILRSNCINTKNKESCKALCRHMSKRRYWFD